MVGHTARPLVCSATPTVDEAETDVGLACMNGRCHQRQGGVLGESQLQQLKVPKFGIDM